MFGTIIQWFARYELLMRELMAAVASADPAAVMVLTRGLDFSDKQQALLDLLYHRAIPLDQYDRIGAYVMVPHTLTSLRNDIAHAAWISDELVELDPAGLDSSPATECQTTARS
jgi:hypothetical protein